MSVPLFEHLAGKTFHDMRFKADYLQLLKLRFSEGNNEPITGTQIKKLMETAALFALSDEENHKKLALKIAFFLFELYKDEYTALPLATEIVLARMGDIPAISTMIEYDDQPDYFSFFEDQENMEEIRAYLKFPEVLAKKTVNYAEVGTRHYLLTDFQTAIFQDLRDGKNVTFTAPTSAGKSFIVQQYIAEQLMTMEKYCAIYIVPTKSLIAEIRDQITTYIRSLGLKSREAMVFNSADYASLDLINRIPKKVIVMTQERLLQLLSSKLDIRIDLLVVDEAQKVNDQSRGIIIEDSVQELVLQKRLNQLEAPLQKIIISPNIADPHRFVDIFNIEDKVNIYWTTKTPVGQNLFFVDFSAKEVNLSLFSQELGANVHLRDLTLKAAVPSIGLHKKKVWTVQNILKGKGHTLIYCNGPAECIKVADGIAEFNSPMPSPELEKGVRFIADHVHPDYYLVDHLKKGIGYHYGRMPQFVRVCVKDLFENRKIDYLCCTSTLLEGVNLPAKNIVLFQPKSGRYDPMDKSTVLNLAGRAGRLLKDYYGNIYCIDFEKWKSPKDIFDGKLEPVKSALERTLTDDVDLLIEHLNKYKKQPDKKKNIETVATSLLVKQLKDPSGKFLRDIRVRCPSIPDAKFDRIKRLLVANTEPIQEIKEIVLQNRSIDPRLQNKLYHVLQDTSVKNLVLPLDPSDPDNYMPLYDNLKDLFKYLSGYITKEENQSYLYYALIAKFWLLHLPYRMILQRNIDYETDETREGHKSYSKKLVNKLINDLDRTLEDTLKFSYARGLKCYVDLLTRVLQEKRSTKTFCAQLPMYLEAGASDSRIFVLLSAGLSRNTAVELYGIMPKSIRDVQSCIEWLRENRNTVRGKLHDFMYQEVDDVIGLEEQG